MDSRNPLRAIIKTNKMDSNRTRLTIQIIRKGPAVSKSGWNRICLPFGVASHGERKPTIGHEAFLGIPEFQ
ncbi:hypothetical protein TNIN_60551 [Trichonephila inaurata madagascariensis]|uniref:Uncharacterized protein n=1 Tax=Trichonephila inaurata madagascariensis TaxID=2747483 RepID=A0A8X6YR12_9ARAC|nr:hypothetical protein TNIN_60551 [Trichonephila inaurata madagascariensis]